MQEELKTALREALVTIDLEAGEIHLEHPDDLAHGEWASNVALACAKQAEMPPRELAEKIVAHMTAPAAVERVDVAGPGFINFHLKKAFFGERLANILEAGANWGKNELFGGKNVFVEHTQPNPFKPFHIGHLMSNAIGESISRVVEFSGAQVKRANYQGDIGPHVAKALWALQEKGFDANDVVALGEAYVVGAAAYEEDPQAKREIDELNQRLYARDPQLHDEYERGKQASLARFEEIYRILGSSFDYYFFESESGPRGLELVQKGLQDGIFEESDGAVVFRGERHGLHTRVFITKAGAPTYEAKELGLAKLKQEAWPFDLNITTVAVEQDAFFKVVRFALEQLIPELTGTYRHVAHGMMRLTGGRKMSSRKGNVVTGESLIENMRELVREKMRERNIPENERQDIVDAVAVAAIKYQILKQQAGKNITYDPDAALSFEGDSGPYLQYAHTRACSVMEKAHEEEIAVKADKLQLTEVLEQSESALALARLLQRFPEIVERAAAEYEPHYITIYVLELAGLFNHWYAHERILDGSEEAQAKLALVEAFQITVRHGLYLLGIRSPERM